MFNFLWNGFNGKTKNRAIFISGLGPAVNEVKMDLIKYKGRNIQVHLHPNRCIELIHRADEPVPPTVIDAIKLWATSTFASSMSAHEFVRKTLGSV